MNKDGIVKAIDNQAEFIEKLQFEQLSSEVVEQAKLVLLDSIGCMAIGNTQYNDVGAENGKYCVVGKANREKQIAIFQNGCAMVRNEMDEGNQFAFGHPACHILPAFLAECQEQKQVSGKEAITALVAAYETACRWGNSAKTKPSMHVHGTMQTAGSAVVVSKLNKCKKDEIVKAIILANSLPQPTTWVSAFHGDQLRNAYIGLSNQVGANTKNMLRMGVESSIDSLVSVWDEVLDGDIEESGLDQLLGKDFYITKNYFKVHAACRYTHSFVDMIQPYMEQGLQPDEIERIDIDTYHAAAKLDGQEARNSFAARFSIPISLAIKILYGELTTKSLEEEHIHDSKVIELASKIFVKEKEEYNKLLPAIRKNRMCICKKDGTFLEQETTVTKGDYLQPFTKEEVIQKFIFLTKSVWSHKRQEKILNYVEMLDKKDSIQELFELIGEEM